MKHERPSGGILLPATLLLTLATWVAGCQSTPEAPEHSALLPADWSRIPEPAQPAIRQAAAGCTDDARACERLAMLYHGNELVDLAARSYMAALDRGIVGGRTPYLLGLIHRERGQSAHAVRRLRAAVAIRPSIEAFSGYSPKSWFFGRGRTVPFGGNATVSVPSAKERFR